LPNHTTHRQENPFDVLGVDCNNRLGEVQKGAGLNNGDVIAVFV